MKTPLIALAILALLPACVNVLPERETPEGLYRFGAMDETHRLSASVVVREPEASRVFAGRALAAEDDTGALRVLRDVQWTDNATRLMQIALVEILDGSGTDVAFASETGAPADFELTWRLADFTLSGETARCRLQATLLNGRNRSIVAQTTIVTEAIALDPSNGARAKALADAGRACVSETGAFVAERTQSVE